MPIIMSVEKKRFALHQAMLLHLSRLELQTSTHPFSPLLGLGCSPGLHSAKVWKTCENMSTYPMRFNQAFVLQDFLWTFCEHFEFWAQICSSFCFYLEIPGFRFRFERYISSLVLSAKARLTLYWPMCCRAPEDGLVCGWELPNRPVCSCGGHWRAKLH